MVGPALAVALRRLVRCGIGRENYGLDMTRVRSIARSDQVRASPGPDGRFGVLGQGEDAVDVYDLAHRLGQDSEEHEALRPVVVLDSRPRPVGLLVDRVGQSLEVPAERIRQVPGWVAASTGPWLAGVLPQGDQLILILNADALVPGAHTDASLLAEEISPISFAGGTPPGEGQLVLFSATQPEPGIRPILFGLSITQVVEVLPARAVAPLPRMPSFVRGLVNWRDWPVPVLDVAARLNLPSPAEPLARLLIVRTAEGALLGIPAHASLHVLRSPIPHQWTRTALTIDLSAAKAVLDLKNETLVLLDLSYVLRRPVPAEKSMRRANPCGPAWQEPTLRI